MGYGYYKQPWPESTIRHHRKVCLEYVKREGFRDARSRITAIRICHDISNHMGYDSVYAWCGNQEHAIIMACRWMRNYNHPQFERPKRYEGK